MKLNDIKDTELILIKILNQNNISAETLMRNRDFSKRFSSNYLENLKILKYLESTSLTKVEKLMLNILCLKI